MTINPVGESAPGVSGRARSAVGRVVRDPSASLLVSQLVTAGVAFVVNIFAARLLEPSGRGELALLLQIAYLCSLGLLLGTDRSTVAVYTGRSVRTVSGAMLRLLRGPSSVCLAVALVVLTVQSSALGTWRTAVALALVFAVVNAFVRAVRSIAIAAGRQREFLVYTLVSEALRMLTLGLLVLTGVRDVALWMLVYVLVGLVPTVGWLIRWVSVRTTDAEAPPAGGQAADARRAARSAGDLSAARREGLQLFPSSLANSGLLRLDRFLLAGLASTAALGLYASVATMTEMLAWPLLAFADSRLGRWREQHDAGVLRLSPILLGVAAYCVVAAGVVAAATTFLLVPLLGPEYGPAGPLVLPLVAAAATLGASQVLISMLIAARRNRTASVVEIVGFGLSIAAYVVLIERFGALGAAYGSLLGYFGCLLLAAVVLRRIRSRL